MANVLAVKQRRTYKMVGKGKNRKKQKVPPPTAANLIHAAALIQASYWLNDGANITKSEEFYNRKDANNKWIDWKIDAVNRYKENHSKGSNPPKNTVLIDEMLLVIGTDINITKDEEKKLIKEYIKKYEEKYNTKVFFWANHDHEGHLDEDGNEVINRHVHMFYSNIDNDGKSVRRQWKREELSNMQTDIFEVGKSVGLNIERATKNEPGTSKPGRPHGGYRKSKTNEELMSLKAGMKILKKELQEAKAKRSNYAELEAKNKELITLIQEQKISAKQAVLELSKTKDEQIVKLESQIYTGKMITFPDAPTPVQETYKHKAEELKKQNQKTKEENEQHKKFRRDEHERTLDRINKATAGLEQTTERDLARITQETVAKRTAEEIDRGIEQSASTFEQFFGEFSGTLQKIEKRFTFDKIELLENALKAKPKEPDLDDALAVISKHSKVAEDAILGAVNQLAPKPKKPDFVIQTIWDGKEDKWVAMTREEKPDFSASETRYSKATNHQKSILKTNFDLITDKLADLIQSLDILVSDTWERMVKTFENPKSDDKKPTNTNTRQKHKRP